MTRELIEIARGVLVTSSRKDTTTSTVMLHRSPRENEVLLVDPAWDPDELDDLADWIRAGGFGVAAGFATHSHHDHVLWHPGFGGGPRWASPAAARTAAEHRDELLEFLGPTWPERLSSFVGRVEPLASASLPWSGQTAEIVVHDGHSTGHAAVWLPATRVLLAGDMLSDLELPLAAETGLPAYDLALTTLRPYVEQAAIVVPGHGHPSTHPMDRWTDDRRYLDSVLEGRTVSDARLGHPGMAAAHAANIAPAD